MSRPVIDSAIIASAPTTCEEGGCHRFQAAAPTTPSAAAPSMKEFSGV